MLVAETRPRSPRTRAVHVAAVREVARLRAHAHDRRAEKPKKKTDECKACATRRRRGLDGQCPACANERARNTPKVAPVVSGPQLDIEFHRAQRTDAPPPPPKSDNERDRIDGNRSVVAYRFQRSTIEALDELVRAGAGADPPLTKTWVVETLLRDYLKKEGFLP